MTKPKNIQRREAILSDKRYELAKLCRRHTEDALLRLIKILEDPKTDTGARLKAIEILFDRGYGKAAQMIEMFQDATDVEGARELTVLERIERIRAKRNGVLQIQEGELLHDAL